MASGRSPLVLCANASCQKLRETQRPEVTSGKFASGNENWRSFSRSTRDSTTSDWNPFMDLERWTHDWLIPGLTFQSWGDCPSRWKMLRWQQVWHFFHAVNHCASGDHCGTFRKVERLEAFALLLVNAMDAVWLFLCANAS